MCNRVGIFSYSACAKKGGLALLIRTLAPWFHRPWICLPLWVVLHISVGLCAWHQCVTLPLGEANLISRLSPHCMQWKAGEGLGTRLIIDLVIKPLKIDVNVMCALQTLPRYSTSSFQMMWTQSRCRLIQFQTAHTVLLYPFKTPLYVYACDGWDRRGEGNIYTLRGSFSFSLTAQEIKNG